MMFVGEILFNLPFVPWFISVEIIKIETTNISERIEGIQKTSKSMLENI